MAEESKTKAKESKQWYHYIPLVGDLIGGFTDDYQSPDLGKTSNQEYKEAVKKGELVEGYIADIDKYKMRQYYEALREEPDFEEKSGYVSTKSTKPFSRLFSLVIRYLPLRKKVTTISKMTRLRFIIICTKQKARTRPKNILIV